jgi:hypothetical protein
MSILLADTLNSTRQLTMYYLNQLKDVDVKKRFEINGFKTNSVHWIVSHLAWSEDFLILLAVGNKSTNMSWFEKFKIGSPYPDEKDFPTLEESLLAFGKIHEESIELLRTMPENAIHEPNHVGLKFANQDTKKVIIQHCIRHEGTHCGHLGWLVKMHGGKTV